MKNLRNKNQPPLAGLVQEYIDSAYDVVYAVYLHLDEITELAEAIGAGDFEGLLLETDIDTLAKLNAIVTDATLLDEADIVKMPFATQGEAEGGVDNTHAMTALRVYQAIATFVDTVPNNYDGNGPPTAFDDADDGWVPGSVWIDTEATPHESYRCSDNTVDAAIWLHTTLTADELATVALTGISDDLTEGVSKLLMTVAERAKLAGIEPGASGDMTPAEVVAAYASLVPQVSVPEKAAGTETALRTFAPADVAGMAQIHGRGVWQESTGNITALKGEKWFYRGTGGHAATLPAAYAVADSPHEIWLENNGTGSFNITPASGDNLIVGGSTLGANVSYSLPIGSMAICIVGVTNTTWIVTVITLPVAAGSTFLDNAFRIQDSGDPTKQISFQAGGITAGQTREITMPDEDTDLTWFRKYKGQNLQTGTTYTLVLSDAGKMISLSNAAAIALTIPANASVAFPVDTRIDIIQYGAGQVTVGITSDTLRGDPKTSGQYKGVSLWKRTSTEWVIFGGTT